MGRGRRGEDGEDGVPPTASPCIYGPIRLYKNYDFIYKVYIAITEM